MILAAIVALPFASAQCASDPMPPECVPGNSMSCRCGDGTYGYRRCIARSVGDRQGRFETACDCVIGLSPDAQTDDAASGER